MEKKISGNLYGLHESFYMHLAPESTGASSEAVDYLLLP